MKTKDEIIVHCFNEHQKDAGELKFTFEEYKRFWLECENRPAYKMKNMDGSYLDCKITYYPLNMTYDIIKDKQGETISAELVHFQDLRALIEIEMPYGTDFREVPVHYLELK